MRKLLIAIIFGLAGQLVYAQDPTQMPLVYQHPDMSKVIARKGLPYKTSGDTTLTFDIYYPPSSEKLKGLPVVIFNNGVGGNDVPQWRVYQDWAKLAAVNGMIAINYQSRQGKALNDSETLIDYMRSHAAELRLDSDRMAIWTCSANVRVGMPLAMQASRKHIRALVVYYGAAGGPDNQVKRQDLEILVVRAGLDSHTLNNGIQSFLTHALQTDARVEFINYPEGQHAFDIVDNTERSREIIKQTLDFLKRKLAKDYAANPDRVLTTQLLRHLILNENKTDEALAAYKVAVERYRNTPGHTDGYNQIINERTLNQLGYQLLQANRTEDGINVLLANLWAFPNSPNSYDGVADAYHQAGNKEKTLEYSRLALDKLEGANLPPQFKQGIRESAESKIRHYAANRELVTGQTHRIVFHEKLKKFILINGGPEYTITDQDFTELWEWTGNGWKLISAEGPPCRNFFAAVYDSNRDRIVMYGGSRPLPDGMRDFREVWEWDGQSWQKFEAEGPLTASAVEMTYDPISRSSILSGGMGQNFSFSSEFWRWNGAQWTKLDGTGPHARASQGIVADPSSKSILLYGGHYASENDFKNFGDFWRWDGKKWTEIKMKTPNPGIRLNHSLLYNKEKKQVWLFGGGGSTGGKQFANDFWVWDNKKWTKLSMNGPTPRGGYSWAINDKGEMIIHGGVNRPGGTSMNDTWLFDGKEWKCKTGCN